jgi:Terpene synthase family 2, C-terminal metal binding
MLQSTIPPRWGDEEIPSRAIVAEALRCPFPLRINKHVQAAHEHSLRWVKRVFGDELLAQKAGRARMAWMVAGFYPTAGIAELSLAADYLCWAFALDDLGDETPIGERPAQLAELFERFDGTFSDAPPLVDEPPAVRALRDIVVRLRQIASPAEVEAFRLGNLAYFGGMLWEANNRAGKWVPHESSFLMLRPAAGAVPPFFALVEPLEKLSLSAAVRAHPQVLELQRLAGGIVCWINDVLSFEKERKLGDVHNLAIVYEVHRALPPGAALSQAVKLSNAEVDGFLARAAALPSFSDDENAALARYIDVLGSMIRITRDWTLGSARYADQDGLARLAG